MRLTFWKRNTSKTHGKKIEKKRKCFEKVFFLLTFAWEWMKNSSHLEHILIMFLQNLYRIEKYKKSQNLEAKGVLEQVINKKLRGEANLPHPPPPLPKIGLILLITTGPIVTSKLKSKFKLQNPIVSRGKEVLTRKNPFLPVFYRLQSMVIVFHLSYPI